MIDEKVYLRQMLFEHVARKGAMRLGISKDRRYNKGTENERDTDNGDRRRTCNIQAAMGRVTLNDATCSFS